MQSPEPGVLTFASTMSVEHPCLQELRSRFPAVHGETRLLASSGLLCTRAANNKQSKLINQDCALLDRKRLSQEETFVGRGKTIWEGSWKGINRVNKSKWEAKKSSHLPISSTVIESKSILWHSSLKRDASTLKKYSSGNKLWLLKVKLLNINSL